MGVRKDDHQRRAAPRRDELTLIASDTDPYDSTLFGWAADFLAIDE